MELRTVLSDLATAPWISGMTGSVLTVYDICLLISNTNLGCLAYG